MAKRVSKINMENARITFRNFSGEPTKFNKAGGQRSFAVVLDQDLALQLKADGWNVKWPKEDERYMDPGIEDPRLPYLAVKVSYMNTPPKAIMINGEGGSKTRLTEQTIGNLDFAQIENVDLIINPYHYEVNGNEGITAYLEAIYVTVVADPFYEKYGI